MGGRFWFLKVLLPPITTNIRAVSLRGACAQTPPPGRSAPSGGAAKPQALFRSLGRFPAPPSSAAARGKRLGLPAADAISTSLSHSLGRLAGRPRTSSVPLWRLRLLNVRRAPLPGASGSPRTPRPPCRLLRPVALRGAWFSSSRIYFRRPTGAFGVSVSPGRGVPVPPHAPPPPPPPPPCARGGSAALIRKRAGPRLGASCSTTTTTRRALAPAKRALPEQSRLGFASAQETRKPRTPLRPSVVSLPTPNKPQSLSPRVAPGRA